MSDLREGINGAQRRGVREIPSAGFAARQRRSDKAGCLATVEVERELETPKKAAAEGWNSAFCPAAKRCIEPYQASQWCPQRRRIHLYELAMLIGMNTANERNLLHSNLPITSAPPPSAIRQRVTYVDGIGMQSVDVHGT